MVHTNHYHPESFVKSGQSFSADTNSMGASSHVGERINFLVILTATDAYGMSGTSYARIQESDWESNHPVARFAVYPSNTVQTGQPVRFDGSASYDIDLDTISFLWDFGDGMKIGFTPITINKFVAHSYSQPGTYTVTLTTYDNWGTSNSTTQDITVTSGYVQSPPAGVVIPADDTPAQALPTATSDPAATVSPTVQKGNQSGASSTLVSVFVVVICTLVAML